MVDNKAADATATYITTAQPSITVPATRAAILPYLQRGWLCQPKIDGWNIQVHISPAGRVVSLTRNRNRLTTGLPLVIKEGLRQHFQGSSGWSVLDGEWVKSTREYYIFDYIVANGNPLAALPYQERMQRLPDLAGPVYKITQSNDIEVAMSYLEGKNPIVEGLVLKDPVAVGFHHQTMRRCRKDGHRHSNRLASP